MILFFKEACLHLCNYVAMGYFVSLASGIWYCEAGTVYMYLILDHFYHQDPFGTSICLCGVIIDRSTALRMKQMAHILNDTGID